MTPTDRKHSCGAKLLQKPQMAEDRPARSSVTLDTNAGKPSLTPLL
jgi:hypothetical protein